MISDAKQTNVHYNAQARFQRQPRDQNVEAAIDDFHRSLPDFAVTPLVELPKTAQEIRVGNVYVKDESSRLGLPSFKILGASWGVFRALAKHYSLSHGFHIDEVKQAIRRKPVALFTATDGNHGRAVGRMGKILGTTVFVYTPKDVDESTVALIRGEGAKVKALDVDYDRAVLQAYEDADSSNGILVQDTAFEGYEEIPEWIVQGYGSTMREVDRRLGDRSADLVIVPVGVGSFAQAVTQHCKRPDRRTKVMTVEPEVAACFKQSLLSGQPKPWPTKYTIMAGMNCGTVSKTAWPVLRDCVDAATIVSDLEAHEALMWLEDHGVKAGPCGAAPLAALRKLTAADKKQLGLTDESIVVLLCTEGARDYAAPAEESSRFKL